MTSKEALKDLIDEIKHTHNNGKTLTEYDQKRTDIIAKDLEILEILCNHLSAFLGTGENDSGTQKIILLRGNILENDKDFEKLKARLEVQEEVNNNEKRS